MKTTLKTVYDQILRDPPVNWEELNQNLAELTTSIYWPSLKTYFESCIGDVLSQADDITAVLQNEMSEEAFGRKALIARVVADKMQQILDFIEGHKPNEPDETK